MRPLYQLILACFVTASMMSSVHAAEHTKESVREVKKNVESGKAVLIDVREQREWDAGHLATAKLKPLSKLAARGADPAEMLKDVPKDKIIYCHCKSGGRALIACDVLKELGLDVRALKPGFADLLEAGFEKAQDAK